MAQEKLEKAKKIAEILEANVYQACWYAALFERVSFHDDVGKAMGESFEAWGVIKSQEAFHDGLVLCLSRIIHGEGDNTASLQALIKILNNPDVQKILETEAANVAENMQVHFINRPELDEGTRVRWEKGLTDRRKEDYIQRLNRNLKEAEILFNKINGDSGKVRILSYRNTKLAHLAIEHDPKKHKTAKYEDAPLLLEKVIPLVDLAVALVTGVSVDFEYHVEETKACADKYWRHVARI